MLSTFPSNKLSDVFLSPTDEEDLKASMKRYAGDRFIKDYENLLNEKSTDSKRILAKSMINLIKQQFIKLKEIEAQYVTPNFEQYKQIIELKPQILLAVVRRLRENASIITKSILEKNLFIAFITITFNNCSICNIVFIK
ncbi:hypothetical protein PMALA_021780 [Plasmodium malariae]|uniref:Uncharacterized protein n=1 Tax=Plasmodium malariae TaxID=5858 RepID=A0A1A8W5F5_PLAMA|nr:hypothetical protein PMALA_021780 [Plasmodium malariae]